MAEQMSFWSLVLNASLLVQLVMLILVLASLISWVMIFERIQVISRAKKLFLSFEERFWSGMDLTQLFRQVNANPDPDNGAEAIFRAGFKEFTRMRQQASADTDDIMASTQRAMRVAIRKEAEKLDSHLPFLATVGSTSPYIGLFGTVWGIMNSFRGLANASQATLSTVAPGISEALIATAMGLFAAIPAVMAYNRFASRADQMITTYDTFSEEFSAILNRQLHVVRSQQAKKAAEEASMAAPVAPKA